MNTDQRAFEDVKERVHKWRDLRRKAINYLPEAEWVNLTADIIAFWSGKFNSAQQNYLVGVKFRIYTDHKGLEWITGVDNTLPDALSRMYSDEPKGTVRAVSCYTGSPIFLGASKRTARDAFPNAKRVVLKVSKPPGPLYMNLSNQTAEHPKTEYRA